MFTVVCVICIVLCATVHKPKYRQSPTTPLCQVMNPVCCAAHALPFHAALTHLSVLRVPARSTGAKPESEPPNAVATRHRFQLLACARRWDVPTACPCTHCTAYMLFRPRACPWWSPAACRVAGRRTGTPPYQAPCQRRGCQVSPGVTRRLACPVTPATALAVTMLPGVDQQRDLSCVPVAPVTHSVPVPFLARCLSLWCLVAVLLCCLSHSHPLPSPCTLALSSW